MARPYRILIAAVIGLLSGALCYAHLVAFEPHGGDFGWILHGVPPLLAGDNPYLATARDWPIRYPLVTLLAIVPFAWMPYPLAAALFFGSSSAGLAYALTREGGWRLLAFTCFPFVAAMQMAQWSPLLAIAYVTPALVPLTMFKPSIGLPIALTTRLTRRDLLVVGAALGLSLLVLPTWPRDMIAQFATHPNVTPIMSLPGLALAGLAAVYHRRVLKSREARFILLFACIPQTLFYDTFLLAVTARTPRAALVFSLCSWAAYFGWFFAPWLGLAALQTSWVIAWLYVPAMLAALEVLRRGRASDDTAFDQIPQPATF